MNKSNLVKLSTTHFYEGRMKRHLCTEEMNEIAKLEELKEMHYHNDSSKYESATKREIRLNIIQIHLLRHYIMYLYIRLLYCVVKVE